MKVKHFLLSFISCFALFHARADYSVYVTYSWLDGVLNYSSEGVIRLQGSSTWCSPVSCEKGSILVTTVPSGHDVCWSYDDDGRNSSTVLNKGHYAHYPENSGKDWFAWPLAEGGAVGVHFDWLKYSISFNGNGGSNSMAPMDGCVYNQPTNLTKNTFAKTGYSFTGWTNVATSVVFTDGARIKGDDFPTLAYTNKVVELYAAWKPNDYMVTFDANGGSVAPASKSVTYDSTYGDLPTPTFNGHTFAGWYTEVTGGSKIESTTKVSIVSDQTLYAHWTIERFSVEVFRDPNCEGSGTVSGGAGSKEYGSEVTIQATPSTGSHFTRWSDGSEAMTRTIVVRSNVTYYATFDLDEYDVTFSYKDKDGNDVSQTQKVKYGHSAIPPDTGVVDQWPKHHFKNWGNTPYGTVTGNLQVSANYESTILMVSLDPGEGASVNPNVLEYEKGETYGKLPVPSCKGYKFLGWRTSSYTYILPTTEVTQTGEQALYAHWEADRYTVTFDPAGGSVSSSSMEVMYNDTYGSLPRPDRDGYEFTGWYTSLADGEEKITSSTKVTITAPQTLYAHWTAKKYRITFDTNGGGSAPSSIEVTYDGTYGTLPVLTRTGYVFGGWWTSSGEGVGIEITAESKVSIIENQTLYAHWSPAPYAVTVGNLSDGFFLDVSPTGTYTKPLELTWDPGAKTGYTLQSFVITLTADGVAKPLATYTSGTATNYTMTGAYYTNINITASSDLTPNHYKVCFYPNGGDGVAFTREFVYDEAQVLPTTTFTRRGYELEGWARDPTADKTFEPSDSVSNLSATDGAVVGLYAKWKQAGVIEQTDFNKALKCKNLSFQVTAGNGWAPDIDHEYASTPSLGNKDSTLAIVLKGPGLLTFKYRLIASDNITTFSVFKAQGEFIPGFTEVKINMADWATGIYQKENEDEETIRWVLRSRAPSSSAVRLSDVTWTPSDTTVGVTLRLNDGTAAPIDIYTNMTKTANQPIGALPVLVHDDAKFLGWFTAAKGGDQVSENWLVPVAETQLYAHWGNAGVEPTEADRRDIASVTMENGELAITFKNADNRFAYSLHGTNDLTAARTLWPVLFTTNGTDTITIKPEVKADEPKFFYYLEVHSK